MFSLSLTLKPLPPPPPPQQKKNIDKDYIKVYDKMQIVICHISQFLHIFPKMDAPNSLLTF